MSPTCPEKRAHIGVVARSVQLSSIFTREHVSLHPAASKAIQRRRRAYHQRFVRAFARAQDAGAFREFSPDHAVSFLLGAANWVFRWYRMETDDLNPDQLADFAVDLLSRGYVTPARELPAAAI